MMKAYLGIDVSKGYADLCLLDADRKLLEKPFQLDDTRAGHDALSRMLREGIARHGLEHVFCGVESTGGFENNWYSMLSDMGSELPVSVARLNPLGVKHSSQAALSRNVTDALSSRYIAQHLIAHPDTVDYAEQSAQYGSYRSLHKHILMLKKQNNQTMNELKMVLYSSFPEIMRYCRSGVPTWVLSILIKYPSAASLAKVRTDTLAKIKGVSPQKAEALHTKAKTSVASRTNATQEFLICSLAGQIRDRNGLIASHKKFLEDTCKGKEVTLLESMVGVGSYTAAAIMIELEDIARFPSPKHLASYFGLHPMLKQSGDRSVSKLSRKGRATLRAILFMPAHAAIMHCPHFKAIYHRHRSKGMVHRQAIVVVMHKMVRMIWGILNSGKPFDPRTDVNNCTSVQSSEVPQQNSELRRLQPMDGEAPISRIEKKKRRVSEESQVCVAEHVRDHHPPPTTNL